MTVSQNCRNGFNPLAIAAYQKTGRPDSSKLIKFRIVLFLYAPVYCNHQEYGSTTSILSADINNVQAGALRISSAAYLNPAF